MADETNNGVNASKHEIRQLTNSDEDISKAWQLWQNIFPDWPISQERFAKLLFALPGYHCIHEHGLCLSYGSTTGEGRGRVAAIGVLSGHRRRGIGSALLEKASIGLREAAGGELKSLEVGSIFPRFWWQIPSTAPKEAKEFFSHRGKYHRISLTVVLTV